MNGFYVHYKGPIYFVHGVAKNMDEGGVDLVIYSSTQSTVVPNELRYRTVEEFSQLVDPVSGGPPGNDPIPRFQKITGFTQQGQPMVRNGNRSGVFVTRYSPDATYQED